MIQQRRQASGWRKFVSVTNAGFKTSIVYRLHFFVSLFGAPINVLIYYFLWKSIFGINGVEIINGYTLSEMVTYYVIVMIVGFITYSEVDEWMEENVVHGYMVNALMKPISYFAWNVYHTLGMTVFALVVEIIPVFIIGPFMGLQGPAFSHILLFVIAVTIAAALYHLFAYLTGLAAFWLKRIRGLRRSRRVLIAFLSGGMIPLTFFPAGMQKVFAYLPFTFMRFTPVQIYLGKVSVADSIISLSIGLAWVLLLYLITTWIWERAFKKFSGAGV